MSLKNPQYFDDLMESLTEAKFMTEHQMNAAYWTPEYRALAEQVIDAFHWGLECEQNDR